MKEVEEIKELLIAIREGQREHLSEYKRIAEQAVELQRRSVKRQEQIGALYRGVVVVALLLILFVVGLIIYLFARLRLF